MIICPELIVLRKKITLTKHLSIALHPSRSRPGAGEQKNVLGGHLLSHLDVWYLEDSVILSETPGVQVGVSRCVTVGVSSVREVAPTNVDPEKCVKTQDSLHVSFDQLKLFGARKSSLKKESYISCCGFISLKATASNYFSEERELE